MDLDKLKNNLPSGYAKTAANDLGVTVSAIYQMLNGNIKMNVHVLEYLVDMAKQNADKVKLAEQTINSLPK